jgi:hypothetical protein
VQGRKEKTSPLIGEIWEMREIKRRGLNRSREGRKEKRMLRVFSASGIPPHKIPATVLPKNWRKSTPAVRSALKPFPEFTGAVLRDF